MIFPACPMVHGASAQDGIEPRKIGFTLITRGCDPTSEVYASQPCVEACTATIGDVSVRTDGGEFDFDVIDEHTTRLWFSNRDSFRAAWAIARRICQGTKLSGIEAGDVTGISAIGRRGRSEIVPTPGLTVEASSHHIAEAA